jgi:hypothetical protein
MRAAVVLGRVIPHKTTDDDGAIFNPSGKTNRHWAVNTVYIEQRRINFAGMVGGVVQSVPIMTPGVGTAASSERSGDAGRRTTPGVAGTPSPTATGLLDPQNNSISRWSKDT